MSQKLSNGQTVTDLDLHTTYAHWETVLGVNVMTLFTSSGVIDVASEVNFMVQVFVGASRASLKEDGEPFNDVRWVRKWDALVQHFGFNAVNSPTVLKAWSRLPQEERERAMLLAMLVSIREHEQSKLDGTLPGDDLIVQSGKRVHRLYEYVRDSFGRYVDLVRRES